MSEKEIKINLSPEEAAMIEGTIKAFFEGTIVQPRRCNQYIANSPKTSLYKLSLEL